jgi:hypothetical protein
MTTPRKHRKHPPLTEAHKQAISRAATGRPGHWKGKTLSTSTIAKMRKAKLGKKLSPAHIQRITESSPRQPLSEAVRAAMRKPHRLSVETRRKMIEASTGARSPLWRGGVSSPEKLARAHGAHWRRQVLARDQNRCQWPHCGATESTGKRKALHAHHIKSFKEYPELRYDVDNGITYCRAHHDEAERQIRAARQPS